MAGSYGVLHPWQQTMGCSIHGSKLWGAARTAAHINIRACRGKARRQIPRTKGVNFVPINSHFASCGRCTQWEMDIRMQQWEMGTHMHAVGDGHTHAAVGDGHTHAAVGDGHAHAAVIVCSGSRIYGTESARPTADAPQPYS